MLEYTKLILEKVSFDKLLFEKELRKSKRWLIRKELKEFEQWCKTKFGRLYPDIISRTFSGKD